VYSQKAKNDSGYGYQRVTKVKTQECLLWEEQRWWWFSGKALVMIMKHVVSIVGGAILRVKKHSLVAVPDKSQTLFIIPVDFSSAHKLFFSCGFYLSQ